MATSDDESTSWLQRLLSRLLGGHGSTQATTLAMERPPRPKRPAEREWALVESVHSAALGSLHQQVLEREGIPVMPREWGGGSAMLGGVPIGISLFVPDDRLDEARLALGIDAMSHAAGEGAEHEG